MSVLQQKLTGFLLDGRGHCNGIHRTIVRLFFASEAQRILAGGGAVAAEPPVRHRMRARPGRDAGLRDLKRSSSLWVHQELQMPSFAWQEGYGAFTVSASRRAAVQLYIDRQEEHHRQKSFQEEYVEFLVEYGVEYDDRYLW